MDLRRAALAASLAAAVLAPALAAGLPSPAPVTAPRSANAAAADALSAMTGAAWRADPARTGEALAWLTAARVGDCAYLRAHTDLPFARSGRRVARVEDLVGGAGLDAAEAGVHNDGARGTPCGRRPAPAARNPAAPIGGAVLPFLAYAAAMAAEDPGDLDGGAPGDLVIGLLGGDGAATLLLAGPGPDGRLRFKAAWRWR